MVNKREKEVKKALKSINKKHNAKDVFYSIEIEKELKIREELIRKLRRKQESE